MKYPGLPVIATEDETLAACAKMSIARFGDGELRLAAGTACSSQRASDALRRELVKILAIDAGMMIAIPNFEATPRKDVWDKYAAPPFLPLYRLLAYGSSFITRPDNAPWIDRPDYWEKVRSLWRNKTITLVVGDEKSLTPELMVGASRVDVVRGPRQHAYSEVDRIEEEIGTPSGTVLLCLGAAATVLAWRLNRKGVHALDVGHIGMFMKHAGAYVPMSSLISKQYQQQNRILHAAGRFGADGHKHVDNVMSYARKVQAASILDYGAGKGALKTACLAASGRLIEKFYEYDPGVPGKDVMPKPVDLVACTDVLEHIEPEKIDNVLRHIHALTRKAAYFVIATRPANKILPDGRNAHLIQNGMRWWVTSIAASGFSIEQVEDDNNREVRVWATKPSTQASSSKTGISTI